MPDYIYLLESRLSPEQHAALVRVQELGQAQGSNVYLGGGAVRDLISGMPIRDLDFTVEGNPFRIARELEKGGARVLEEDERLRHVELVFTGDVDGSISAARDEVFALPGTKPEIRWATVMEDLRRRDFSLNAIAISLNPASRGLLLDPANGLADLERREVRSLSIHGFTNYPVRLLRIVRYCTRMGFKMEPRTREWFDLALERGLLDAIPGADLGREMRQLGREDSPSAILKAWESQELIGAIHPRLEKRHPDYDGLRRLARVTETMVAAGVRPRLFAPVMHYLLARLKSREQSTALGRMELRSAEVEAVVNLEAEADKVVKMLKSRKTATPRDAFFYLEKVPRHLLAFLLVECSQAKVLGKIRNYIHKWRPLRVSLPVSELDALGVPRGPKFDKVLEDLFDLQLRGRARNPQDRTKYLRQLAGIKPEPKKPATKEKRPERKTEKRAKGAEEAKAAPTAAGKLKATRTVSAGVGEKAAPAARQESKVVSAPAKEAGAALPQVTRPGKALPSKRESRGPSARPKPHPAKRKSRP